MGLNREEILYFEADENILNFKFLYGEQMMWPYIRFTLLNYFKTENEEKNFSIDSNFDYREKVSLRDQIHYIITLFLGLGKKIEKKDILFITSCIFCTEKKNNRWYNWLYDPYAELFPDNSFIFERSYGYKFFRPRFFQKTRPYDDLLILQTIQRKTQKPNYKDLKTIDDFIKYIEKRSKVNISDGTREYMKSKLCRMSVVLPLETSYWHKKLAKIKPKLLFINDGSSGGYAHIYKIAHNLGIICCELQHGLTNKEYYAYNYHTSIIENKDYIKYMPDYLLTFGEYWNQMNESSTRPVTIGSPKLSSIEKSRRIKQTARKKVVFISDYIIIDYFAELLQKLKYDSDAFNIYEFSIRPHPSDYSIMDKYCDLSKQTGIRIIKDETIQKTLQEADAIVSEASTVIFEALCYNTEIFIRDSEISRTTIPEEIGHKFTNANDLYDCLEIINWSERKKMDTNNYFDKNWESNYKSFINTFI